MSHNLNVELGKYSAPGEPPEEIKALIEGRCGKALRSALYEMIDDEFYRLKSEAWQWLAEEAATRAAAFFERLMAGEPDAGRALFGDDTDGSRRKPIGHDAGEPWARLIHGSLFQTREVEWRQRIVELHADLLKDERVKDLEATVEGLTAQLRKTEAEVNRLIVYHIEAKR